MRKKKFMFILCMILSALFLSSCGSGKKGKVTDGSEAFSGKEKGGIEEVEILKEEGKIYVVTAIDPDRSTLTLQDWETTREKPFTYNGATYFKGKYGDNLTVSRISAGELVSVERRGETLTNVQVASDGFSYDDLHNFTLDMEKQIVSVGGSTYFFDDKVAAFHGSSKISLSEISAQDTICLRGIDRQIYTIQVQSGHGTVVLENTDVFQGGYVTIGNQLSMKIVPQMRIEVAEGTYLLAVANDGYGGSREITVAANQETVVDLNELKGEGPQFCTIQFKIEPAGGTVFLDGQQVDISKPVEVRYGVHKLTAKAEGYAEWKRTLLVNSKTAELTIKLTDKESDDTISTSNSNPTPTPTPTSTPTPTPTPRVNATKTPAPNTNNNQNNTNNNNNSNNNNNNSNQNNNTGNGNKDTTGSDASKQ